MADATYWVSVTADGGNGCENPAGNLREVPVSVKPNAPGTAITGVTISGDQGNGQLCLPPNGEVTLTATSHLTAPVFHRYNQAGQPVSQEKRRAGQERGSKGRSRLGAD